MKRVEDQGFEYVAIFDADFEPPADFMYQTVIHMMRDDNVAFVQTRWTFTNCNSLLTWAQKVRGRRRCTLHAARGLLRAGCRRWQLAVRLRALALIVVTGCVGCEPWLHNTSASDCAL